MTKFPNIKLFNSLIRKKQIFKPIHKERVGIYTCGPTVYSYQHIGNLRSYVFSDILKRILIYNNYKVKQIMNVTDVGHLTSDADTGEDKIEKAAKKEKKTAKEIANYYWKIFKEDFKKLNIIEPNIWSKATEHIKEQIDLIKILEKKGYTYKTSDGIYFDASKFKNYGQLAQLKKQKLQPGKRIALGQKKNPTDFALWKFSEKPGQRQQEWKSPWEIGFPGWHLECSAMGMKYLGNRFDIHTGGIDHIPIHHTNEIAQNQAATGHKVVNYWMHGEFLVIDLLMGLVLKNNIHICPKCEHSNLLRTKKDYIKKIEEDGILLMVRCKKCKRIFSGMIKMAKSKRSFLTLTDIEKYSFYLKEAKVDSKGQNLNSRALRYLFLNTHYRKTLEFSWKSFENARISLGKIIDKIKGYKKEAKKQGKVINKHKKRFLKAINDDLNMPKAIAVLWKLIRSEENKTDKLATILDFDKVFGLGLDVFKKEIEIKETIKLKDEVKVLLIKGGAKLPSYIRKLVEKREESRIEKKWTEADELRKKIKKFGYWVEDTAKGPKVKKM